LIDSSFETIIEAIKEGRGIFDNIRKVILYLMSDAYEEIVAVVLTIIFNLPLPVTAAQILWINIVSDGFPHLALAIDPKVEGIMDRPPRSPKSVLISRWMKELIIVVSLSGGIIAYLIFNYYLNQTENYEVARSVAFATLGINTLIYVFSVRTLMMPFYKENFFNNKWLNIAVFVGLFFQVLPFAFPPLRGFFELHPLTIYQWASVFAASFVMFAVIEFSKIVFHHLIHNRKYL
jgi:Ca2+-transporting ATPase